MAKAAVGSMSDWSGVLKDLFRQIDDGSHTLEAVRAFNEHRLLSPLVTLVEATTKKLAKFFGKGVDVAPLPPDFTPDNLARWAAFGLRPVFLPGTEITEDCRLKDWVKPEVWFYQQIKAGKLASDSTQLKQGWYLADFTVGTDYTNGSQVFPDDPLASIITQLRNKGKVGRHDNTPAGSRFSITYDEWVSVVLPAVAQHLGFQPDQIHLERAIEFNAIGNLYDSNRGKYNMWEWFHDVFEGSDRLCGGHRECGGLARVDYDWSGGRDDDVVGRPLVSFVK